jgi:hypothetical protein
VSTPSPASRRLTALARRLEGLDRVIVDVVGQAVLDALDDAVARDTGGNGSLSGVAGGRYRLTTKVTPLSNPAGVRIRPSPKQTGMWKMLDSGRRGGYTVAARPRRRHKSKARKARNPSRDQAMAIGGVWRAGPYTVNRSTRGRGTWRRGVDTGRTAGIAAARDELRRAVHG